MSGSPVGRRPFRKKIVTIHRWLGIAAAAFWLIQAVTGTLLAFHFEIEDALLSSRHQPTDLAAIEERLEAFDGAGGKANVIWIWTTAGLPDRYIISHQDPDGVARKTYIDGAGAVLRDAAATDYSFLQFVREIHLTLAAGTLGHWLLAVTGLLLVTNLIAGLIAAWPVRGQWRGALIPRGNSSKASGLYSWHRAVGLWAVIPAIVISATGAFMLFEHELGDLLGVPELALPANPPTGAPIGFAAASRAATAAIPGSRFVGTTMPSESDASYYAWVRAPGELYRGGYGGSLVIVDANNGTARGAWPATEAPAARAFLASFYPLHTGESLGLTGRILSMAIGLWLTVSIVLGILLWLKRRPRRGAARLDVANTAQAESA